MPEGHDVDELYFVGVVVDPEDGIAINDQWRICFRFQDGDVSGVEVCVCH
jgi:hypothetical protein